MVYLYSHDLRSIFISHLVVDCLLDLDAFMELKDNVIVRLSLDSSFGGTKSLLIKALILKWEVVFFLRLVDNLWCLLVNFVESSLLQSINQRSVDFRFRWTVLFDLRLSQH
jgi:hypothetical protein